MVLKPYKIFCMGKYLNINNFNYKYWEKKLYKKHQKNDEHFFVGINQYRKTLL